jgi:hypothetical protein
MLCRVYKERGEYRHLDAHPFEQADSGRTNLIMKDATQRSIFRWIHLVFSIPILGYIYSPFEKLPDYAPATRFVFLPGMVLTGLWMWKGHVLRRFISKRSS